MRINMQITSGFDGKVNQPVTGDLVEHVIQKRNAGRKVCLARAVEINLNRNLGFEGVALNRGLPHDCAIQVNLIAMIPSECLSI